MSFRQDGLCRPPIVDAANCATPRAAFRLPWVVAADHLRAHMAFLNRADPGEARLFGADPDLAVTRYKLNTRTAEENFARSSAMRLMQLNEARNQGASHVDIVSVRWRRIYLRCRSLKPDREGVLRRLSIAAPSVILATRACCTG